MKTQAIAELYKNRIDELLGKLETIEPDDIFAEYHHRATVESCFLGALGVIEALYGANSLQAKTFLDSKKASKSIISTVESTRGTLLNIQEELDAGLIRSIATEAAGEVIGDLVALAKAELKARYIQVAAVLASAALEDALKRKAEEMGLNVQGKSLNNVISSLKSKSFFKGAQVSIVSSYVKLRNAAMHAEWEKIQEADVSSLIGFLEPFLLEHFS